MTRASSRMGRVVFAVALFAAPAAWAHTPSAPTAPAGQSLQGEQSAWIDDPHMHAFYELAVSAFAKGAKRVDEAKFNSQAMSIFGDFGRSRGVSPGAMRNHLKLIPGQVVEIAKKDPSILASYSNFVAAVFGPK